MKKIVAVSISLMLCLLCFSCAPAVEESPADMSSETPEASESSKAPVSQSDEKETSKPAKEEKEENTVEVYNVRNYGANPKDGTEDSTAIQKAIDDASLHGGGTVYIPAGTYRIANTLNLKAKVSLRGDGMWTTTLSWVGGKDSAIINTANEALWGVTIENLFFTGSAKNNTVGILGGSTLKNYNSAIGSFKNLCFSGLYCGILGNAEPAGVGIFDCYFENIFCSNCTYGIHLYGSGNTIVHPRIATCEYGLTLDYLNGESFDGVHVIGGIFASNGTDIYVPNQSGTRPCNFVGTWFENAKHGILTISKPLTRIMNMTFRDCMLNSAADQKNDFMFDARNAYGVVTLDSCTIVNNAGILAPTQKNSRLAITNLQAYDATGVYVLNDTDSGCWTGKLDGKAKEITIPHALREMPRTANVTPGCEAASSQPYYVTFTEKNVTITFAKAPAAGDYTFYWEVKR